ncbi:MAG: hypothetical protein PHG00_17575 [Methylococcales bacterium]|nr:hypothetical protein [Methylococcales bacterium]
MNQKKEETLSEQSERGRMALLEAVFAGVAGRQTTNAQFAADYQRRSV